MLEHALGGVVGDGRRLVPAREAGRGVVVARDDLVRIRLEVGVVVPQRRADVDVVEQWRGRRPLGVVDDAVVDPDEALADARHDPAARA